MRIIILILIVSLLANGLFCQTGGDNVYEFLNLVSSGRVTALGGANVSLAGNDLNMSYHNPALLSAEMDKALALSYANYFAGINYGLVMYSESLGKYGNLAGGLTYLNYGSFTEADPTGMITGSFKAAEYALSLIYARLIDSSFSVGANFKPVLSQLERYSSFGFAIDVGGTWQNKKKNFMAGIVLKNIGVQLTTYAGEPHQKLPFEIQAGISHKLVHAPLRLSLTLRNLQTFDLSQYRESGDGNDKPGNAGFSNNLLKHIVPGLEIIPHKNFYISAGYNMRRRLELNTGSSGSAAGLTWGFGINTSLLDIEFGRAVYHVAGASTNISLILRMNHIYKNNRPD
ncbi:MAG TPA: type IX secretion system protein PorQ [Bacteroidales bacterium]|nr:type IX secretion system protein PorQ [Bacteroidales bacterium]